MSGETLVTFTDPFGLRADSLDVQGPELKDALRKAKLILTASAGNGDAKAQETLAGIQYLEDASFTIAIKPGATTQTSGDGRTITYDLDELSGRVKSTIHYPAATLVHELGHAFTNPNNQSNPLYWNKTDFVANSWENTVRIPLHMCPRNVESHAPVPLHGC